MNNTANRRFLTATATFGKHNVGQDQRRAAAGWDRRTDGQTPDRCVEPGPHTTRAVAAKWADYPNDRIRIIEKIETKVRP